ncbi:HAMP domain-containing histidine kinase [Myxococcota bacterium]|nr:HAMP domain-containing histidine kinase [Myxococcota bacterium]MCZ7618037.1 HAMP domain-containing histidine kinase [Myxococcota bacterium]
MRRSIWLPLTIGIVLVVLALTLAVAWNVIVVSDLGPVAERLSAQHWALLVAGSLFFATLIAGLLLLCAWLVREMRHSQRQQAFLDAVTHEMKTPLASLRLYVETLVLRDPGPTQRREFLDRMRADVDRLERTVTQVLAAARAAAWTRRAQREPVAVGEVLTACVSELRDRYRLGPEAVRLDLEGAPVALGQPDELALVFRNLIDNAVKYSGPEIDVRVRARAVGDGSVRVEIEDRGVGIAPRELRRIFQPFYRAGLDVQRRVAGLGLGLFIVRWLVQRQGGRVEARSEGPGRGSHFIVSLRSAPQRREYPLAPEFHVLRPDR